MFKTIQGFPQYAISTDGEVIHKQTKYLKTIRVKNGYCFVGLTKNRKKKWLSLHRLVAIHFLQKQLSKPFVNHKDGNKLNNHVTNLEWCTRLENNRHSIRIGLRDPEANRIRPVVQYNRDGLFIKEWKSGRFACRQLGISETVVSMAALGKRKTAGGYRWAFKDRLAPVLSR